MAKSSKKKVAPKKAAKKAAPKKAVKKVAPKKVTKKAAPKKAAPAPVVVEATVVAPTLFAEPTTDTPTA